MTERSERPDPGSDFDPVSGAEADAEAGEDGLACLVDDAESPAEVTVFSREAERMTTEWITAAYEDAVPRSEWA